MNSALAHTENITADLEVSFTGPLSQLVQESNETSPVICVALDTAVLSVEVSFNVTLGVTNGLASEFIISIQTVIMVIRTYFTIIVWSCMHGIIILILLQPVKTGLHQVHSTFPLDPL